MLFFWWCDFEITYTTSAKHIMKKSHKRTHYTHIVHTNKMWWLCRAMERWKCERKRMNPKKRFLNDRIMCKKGKSFIILFARFRHFGERQRCQYLWILGYAFIWSCLTPSCGELRTKKWFENAQFPFSFTFMVVSFF